MKRVKTKSGITGWQCKLQENYDNDFEKFESYCEIYNIHERLGFKTILEAWNKNPLIEGSTNPSDLRVSKQKLTKNDKK